MLFCWRAELFLRLTVGTEEANRLAAAALRDFMQS